MPSGKCSLNSLVIFFSLNLLYQSSKYKPGIVPTPLDNIFGRVCVGKFPNDLAATLRGFFAVAPCPNEGVTRVTGGDYSKKRACILTTPHIHTISFFFKHTHLASYLLNIYAQFLYIIIDIVHAVYNLHVF